MLRGTSALFNTNGLLASFAPPRGQTTMDARSVRPYLYTIFLIYI